MWETIILMFLLLLVSCSSKNTSINETGTIVGVETPTSTPFPYADTKTINNDFLSFNFLTEPERRPGLFWEDNETLVVSESIYIQDSCDLSQETTYRLSFTNDLKIHSTDLLINENLCSQKTDFLESEMVETLRYRLQRYGREFELLPSPDGNHIFIIMYADISGFSIIHGDENLIPPTPSPPSMTWNTIHQGFLFDVRTEELHHLLKTGLSGYDWRWASDSRHITFSGACYGGGTGQGFHVLDTVDVEITTLTDRYHGNCEGNAGFIISPNGEFIILHNTFFFIDEQRGVKICPESLYLVGRVFTEDSNSAYIVCSASSSLKSWENSQIYEFDTTLKELKSIGQLDSLPILVRGNTEIAISPDREHLALWGGDSDSNIFPFGVWIINLSSQ